jgi:signal transduction histidine kinase
VPTLGESIARRRVFWALVVLVVGPTIALFAYGLAGVKDRGDAAEARLHERYALQSREIESGLIARLAEEDEKVRKALSRLDGESLLAVITTWGARGGVVTRLWAADDPAAPADIAEVAAQLSEQSPVGFVLAESGDEGAVAVSRVREGLVVAYRIDAAALDALAVPEIAGRLFPTERTAFHVRAEPADPPGEPVSFDGLRRALALRLVEEEPFFERPMAAPFQNWSIVVDEPTVPEERGMGALRWTMIVLFAATVVGVVLMGRAITQQTRLSRLQTDFVSHISHELRTPLTSIRLFVETLQSGRVTDPEKVQECLGVISAETERLSRKIERVLTLARMESGRREYEMVRHTPGELVEDAVAAFRAHILDADVAVNVDVPAGLPAVLADREAMTEALVNLLANARKYGGDRVKIGLYARPARGGVSLVVEDDGPGIPFLDQRRVFEKFYRSDSLLSQRTQGSGLGLAIVQGIVTAHKGKLSLDSVEGAGSRFAIWLPAAPVDGAR